VDYLYKQLRSFEESSFFNVSFYEKNEYHVLGAVIQFFLERLVDTAKEYSWAYMETQKQSSATNSLHSHYGLTRRWEPAKYPLFLFNRDKVSVTSLWPDIKRDQSDLWFAVTRQKPKLLQDMSQQESIYLLSIAFGKTEAQIEKATRASLDPTNYYVLTRDNTLKLIAIYFRIETGIPVIIMGETGCGKTRLVEFLAAIHQVGSDPNSVESTLPLVKRDVHGGTTEEDILRDIDEARAKLEALDRAGAENAKVYIFFDEINTCHNLGLFKGLLYFSCLHFSTP